MLQSGKLFFNGSGAGGNPSGVSGKEMTCTPVGVQVRYINFHLPSKVLQTIHVGNYPEHTIGFGHIQLATVFLNALCHIF